MNYKKRLSLIGMSFLVIVILLVYAYGFPASRIDNTSEHKDLVLAQYHEFFTEAGYHTFLVNVTGILTEDDYFHYKVLLISEHATSTNFTLVLLDNEGEAFFENKTQMINRPFTSYYLNYYNMTGGFDFPFIKTPSNTSDSPYVMRVILYYDGEGPASMDITIQVAYHRPYHD